MKGPLAVKTNFNRKQMLFVIAAAAITMPVLVRAQCAPANHVQITAPADGSAHDPGDIGGSWQGVLEFPASDNQPGTRLRIVLKVEKSPAGGWTALNYSIDQGWEPMRTADVTLRGTSFSYSIPSLHGSYKGQLSKDGNCIVGNWTQTTPLPLVFVRATTEAAWEIPKPPPPRKPMAADADPSFEVATIKPSTPDSDGKYFRVYDHRFMTHNTTLADLIEVAYGVNPKQISEAPGWAYTAKYDLVGEPDKGVEPNSKQWLLMVQKLLAERFSLKFHHEKREISAYVLSVGKNGPKNLTRSPSANPLPSLEFRPVAEGVLLPAKNAAISQFAQMMQQVVLDRPVVDQTGIEGRFDFELTFTPNNSQFDGHPPSLPQQTDTANISPGLFEAIQQQLGLKLTAEKIPVDTIVIDHVERPSEN